MDDAPALSGTLKSTRYDEDFALWCVDQADLLRQGRLERLDRENLIEEIEALSRSERRELASRLSVLIMHLLKRRVQPERRSSSEGSWRSTINEQRFSIDLLLEDSPSLKGHLRDPVFMERIWREALREASRETTLPLSGFPGECPWLIEQVLDQDFLPD